MRLLTRNVATAIIMVVNTGKDTLRYVWVRKCPHCGGSVVKAESLESGVWVRSAAQTNWCLGCKTMFLLHFQVPRLTREIGC